MASTPAQICNIALARVGERQLLDDLGENSTAAELASAHYESARDDVLEAFDWRFARKRAALAELAGQNERPGWEYVFSLPTDCIAPRYIDLGVNEPAPDEQTAFDLELNDAGDRRVLVTNLDEVELVYTARVTAVGLFSPAFVNALAWRLAMEFALALPVKPQVGLAMERGYQMALATAAARQFNQTVRGAEPNARHIRAR